MSVETVNHISDLNPAFPTGADAKANGDDHLRNIKKALKADFPAITGPVLATQAELNLLQGVTALATQQDIDDAVFSATLPAQSGNAGKFLTTDGTAASFASIDGRGDPVLGKGNSGTTAQVINYANGEGQTLTATGSFSLSATGFPAGRFAGVMLKLINGGAYALSSTGITWKKADGTETTTFASAGYTLQSAGSNFILLMSYGDGTIYGLVR